jgi:hypothetical protein
MSEITIEAGTPEAVAFRLLEKVLALNPGHSQTKEDLLKLYQDCFAAVRGPVAEDLLASLSLED